MFRLQRSQSCKIIVKPPGPKARSWIERNKAARAQPVHHLFPSFVASKAEGVYVTDVDGNVYIDFRNQYANTGHANPKVIAAIKKQIAIGGCKVGLLPKVILAERLKEIAPGALSSGKVGFARGGTAAAERVILMVRSYSRRAVIFACQGSYHGDLLGSLSLTMGRPELKRRVYPLMPDVVHVPFPYCYRCPYRQEYPECGLVCADYIESVLDTVAPPEETAAFFVEPIQQLGGVVIPPHEYFRKIRKICDKHRILLVDDEVAIGFGRTGKMFGIEHWGTEPDIMFMGKPIANGLDLSAVIGRAEVMKFYRGSYGNSVSCAAAVANIETILKEKLVENAAKVGKYTMRRLEEMQNEHESIGDVRGKGLLIGLELVENQRKKPGTKIAEKVSAKAYEKGLLIGVVGTYKQVLRLTPPLTMTIEQVDRALGILEKSFRELNI